MILPAPPRRRLTGELTDVPTGKALRRNLIRWNGGRIFGTACLQGAVIAVSVQDQTENWTDIEGIDPDGAFEPANQASTP
jgi:hypothetical protein